MGPEFVLEKTRGSAVSSFQAQKQQSRETRCLYGLFCVDIIVIPVFDIEPLAFSLITIVMFCESAQTTK